MALDEETEQIAKKIVDAAFQVHKHFGPGMLESIYEMSFFRKLQKEGLSPARQVPVPVTFEGESFETGFRADIIVNQAVLVELKACENILPVHRAQTLSYTRLSGLKLGFLINFNVPLIKNGIVRIIDEKFAAERKAERDI